MVTYTDSRGSRVTSVDPAAIQLAPGDAIVRDPNGNAFVTSQANAAAMTKWLQQRASGDYSTPCPSGQQSSVSPVAPGTPLVPGNVWVYDKYGNQYQTTPDLAAGLQNVVNSREAPLKYGYSWVEAGGQRMQIRSETLRALGDPSDPNFHAARQEYWDLLSSHGLSRMSGDGLTKAESKQQELKARGITDPLGITSVVTSNERTGEITRIYTGSGSTRSLNKIYDVNDDRTQWYDPIDSNGKVLKAFYVPEGSYMQQEFRNVKVGVSESGEVSIYENLGRNEYGAQRMAINPDTGALEPFILIGGGGRNAAQSGMFTLAAATPAVFGRGEVQKGSAGLINPFVMAPELAGSTTTGEEIFRIVEGGNAGGYDIRDYLSRLGAEGYGGIVTFVDGRTLGSTRYEDRSNRAAWNLAAYVDPLAVNRGKADLPGANIPWSVGFATPAAFFMDQNTVSGDTSPVFSLKSFSGFFPTTNVSGITRDEPVGLTITSALGMGSGSGARLRGTKTIAGEFTFTNASEPSKSPIDVWTQGKFDPFSITTEKPKGDIFGMQIPVLSDVVAFFQPGKEVRKGYTMKTVPEVTTFDRREQKTLPNGTIQYTDYYNITGGTIANETITERSTKSGFDLFLDSFNQKTGEVTGINKLPAVTTEQIKKMGPMISVLGMPFGAAPLGLALQTPVVDEYAASYVKGEADAFREKPGQALVMYGAGVLMGGAFRTGEAIYGVGKAGIASKVIAEGGIWRGIATGGDSMMSAGPKILGGLYVLDVASRTTNAGTDFSPAAAERAGGIMFTEARPMTFGFITGHTAPGKVYDSVRTSDIGFKAALQEGRASGRFQYYVGERIGRPFRSLNNDYIAYAQEKMARTPSVSLERPSVHDYLLEKMGINRDVAPEPTTLKYGNLYEEGSPLTQGLYGKGRNPFQMFADTMGAGKTPAPEIPSLAARKVSGLRPGEFGREWFTEYRGEPTGEVSADLSMKAYGKSRGIRNRFNDITMGGNQQEINTLNLAKKYRVGEVIEEISHDPSFDVVGKVYPRNPVRQRVAGWMQEHPNIKRDMLTGMFTPNPKSRFATGRNTAKEISDFNAMTRLNREFRGGVVGGSGSSSGGSGGGTGGGKFRLTQFGTGLAKEQTLASQGIKDTLDASTRAAVGRRTDFRGRRGSMKSMKQASGQMSVMSEELAPVEGMTRGRAAQYQRVMSPFGTPQALQMRGAMQEVEPSLQFRQTQRQEKRNGIVYAPSALMVDPARYRVGKEVAASSSVRSLLGVIPAAASRQNVKIAQDSRQTQRQRTDLWSEIAQVTGQRQTQTPRQRVVPREFTLPRNIVTPIPVVKLPGIPFIGDGSGAAARGRGKRAHKEIIPVEAWLLGGTSAPRRAAPRKTTRRKKK